jgi:hypothetical protein
VYGVCGPLAYVTVVTGRLLLAFGRNSTEFILLLTED